MTCHMTKQISTYATTTKPKDSFVPPASAFNTDMVRRLSYENTKNNFQTPNGKRSKRKFVEEDIEV